MKHSLSPGDSYKILVEWARHHNERLSYFNNIHMLIHGAIVTAIGYIVYDKKWPLDRNDWLILALSLLGIISAWFWRRGLLRMRFETDMRFGQLRALERLMDFQWEQQIFEEGDRFFHGNEARKVRLEELIKLKEKQRDHKIKDEIKWEGLGLLDRLKARLMRLPILDIKERDLSLLDIFLNLLWILIFAYSIIIIFIFSCFLYVFASYY